MDIRTTSPILNEITALDLTKKTHELEKINQELLKDIKAAFENAISKANSAGGSLATEKLEELYRTTESSIQQISKEAEDKLIHSQRMASAPSSATIEQASPLLLSVVLNDLLKEVNASIEEAIKKAENAGVSLKTIEAGKQIVLAIEQAKNAYAASLSFTVDKIDKVMTSKIDELKKMAADIKENDEKNLSTLDNQAQHFIKETTLPSWQHQLKNVDSKYIAIGDTAEKVMISFYGSFFYGTFRSAPKEGFEPSLTLRESTFKPINTGKQRIDFLVPIEQAFLNAATNKHNYTLASLQMPYEAGWISSNKQIFQYNVWVETPPFAPEKNKSSQITPTSTEQAPQEIDKEKAEITSVTAKTTAETTTVTPNS